jgi:hypothetical protein
MSTRKAWLIGLVLVLAIGATWAGARAWHGAATAGAAAAGGPAATTAPFGLSASAAASAPDSPSASPSPSRAEPAATASAAHPSAHAPTRSAGAVPAGSREVTFVNDADQTIWVAGAEQTAQPALGTTGWVLNAGESLAVAVPDSWNGRFWGRTGCSFDAAGSGHCRTGDCGGRFQCTGYGSIPATLAEFDLDAWDGLDFYDVSMVDGSNLPMYINITGGQTKDPISSDGCVAAGCTKPVQCPAALVVDGGAGCESACGVFGTDQYCCRGQWSSRAACRPAQWPVDYAAVFKDAEPYAYSYVDDDATSVFTCKGGCDYRITFGVTP